MDLFIVQLVRTFVLPAPVHSVAFYNSGNRMVAGVNNDTLYIVDTASGKAIHQSPGAHENRIRNVAVVDGDASEPGSATVFTSSSDGFVKVLVACFLFVCYKQTTHH